MFRYSVVFFVLLLSACQTRLAKFPTLSDDGLVPMAGGSYQLIRGWPGPAQQVLQQITWQQGEELQEFLLSAELRPDSVLLVALSAVGHELWRLSYDKTGVLNTSGIEPFNQPIVAARILAEMQLALLPAELLKPQLLGIRLAEQQEPYSRLVVDKNNQTMLQIFWLGSAEPAAKIELVQPHYRLTIVTLQQEFL